MPYRSFASAETFQKCSSVNKILGTQSLNQIPEFLHTPWLLCCGHTSPFRFSHSWNGCLAICQLLCPFQNRPLDFQIFSIFRLLDVSVSVSISVSVFVFQILIPFGNRYGNSLQTLQIRCSLPFFFLFSWSNRKYKGNRNKGGYRNRDGKELNPSASVSVLLCSIFGWTMNGKPVGMGQEITARVKVQMKTHLLSHWKQPFPFSAFSSLLDIQTWFLLPSSLLFFRLWISHTIWHYSNKG